LCADARKQLHKSHPPRIDDDLLAETARSLQTTMHSNKEITQVTLRALQPRYRHLHTLRQGRGGDALRREVRVVQEHAEANDRTLMHLCRRASDRDRRLKVVSAWK
jgi:Arc/MetJ family transcription regulator